MAGKKTSTPNAHQAGAARSTVRASKGVVASYAQRFSRVVPCDQEPGEYLYSINAGNLERVQVRLNGKWLTEGKDYLTKASTKHLKRPNRHLEFLILIRQGDHVELAVF